MLIFTEGKICLQISLKIDGWTRQIPGLAREVFDVILRQLGAILTRILFISFMILSHHEVSFRLDFSPCVLVVLGRKSLSALYFV